MKATIPLVARKGRASYLGERSSGHQDPGATSAWLLMKTAAETLVSDEGAAAEPLANDEGAAAEAPGHPGA
jgi:dihydroxyacetone kinase-like protein